MAHSARLGVTHKRPLENLLDNLDDSNQVLGPRCNPCYVWFLQLLTSSDYSQAEDPSLEMTLSTKTSDTVTRNVDFVQI